MLCTVVQVGLMEKPLPYFKKNLKETMSDTHQYRNHPNSPCAQPKVGFPKTKKNHWSNKPPHHNNGQKKKD